MTTIKYNVYWCKDCEIDFLFRANKHKPNICCPVCGDSIMTERVKTIWMERHYVHYKQWSDEEDDIVVECRKRNMPVSEILELLEGRTNQAVYRRISRLKELGRIG